MSKFGWLFEPVEFFLISLLLSLPAAVADVAGEVMS